MYRPASARSAPEPSYDNDAGLIGAQPEPEESSEGHSRPSEDVEPYTFELKEGLSNNKKSTTRRLGRRPLTKRPQAIRRPRPRNRKQEVEGLVTAGRLKSLPTTPVKTRQDPLNPAKPNEDAHITGSELGPGPPPPLRIWKHKSWDPSTADRNKIHNIRMHQKLWMYKRRHKKASKVRLR